MTTRQQLSFGAVLLVTSSLFGCGAKLTSVSDAKSAYLVKQGFLGTDVYHCTAAAEKPVCKKVVEK